MIVRFTAAQLRKMADQLDAYTALEAAGAKPLHANTVISVDGVPIAYAHWWDDAQRYLAEIIDFTPGDAAPLYYHSDGMPTSSFTVGNNPPKGKS